MERLIPFAILPILLENIVLLIAPQLLARFAFYPVTERRVALPRPKRVPADDAAYRSAALTRAPHEMPRPQIGRVQLKDGILSSAGRGRWFTLWNHRHFGGRTAVFLVRIDLALEGDELVLRARQTFFLLTLPLVGLVVGARGGAVPAVLMMLGGAAFALLLQDFSSKRNAAIAQAFDVLEKAITPAAPVRRKRKRRKPAGLARGARRTADA